MNEHLLQTYQVGDAGPAPKLSADEWCELPLEDRMCAPVPDAHIAALRSALGELADERKLELTLTIDELAYLHGALAFPMAQGEIDVHRDEKGNHPLLELAHLARIPHFDEVGFELLPEAPVEVDPREVASFPLGTVDGVQVALLHMSDGAYWHAMPARLRQPDFFLTLPSFYGVGDLSEIPNDGVRTRAIEAMMLARGGSQAAPEMAPPRPRRAGRALV